MIQPSLQIGGGDWAVKETKLLGTNPVLNEKLPVEISFNRIGSATFKNKKGVLLNSSTNLPRINYDNGLPELLVEPQSTNNCTYSEDITNASWSKWWLSIVKDTHLSPYNTLTAASLIETTYNNMHRVLKSENINANRFYTTTFRVKKISNNRNIEVLVIVDDRYVSTVFDLETGLFVKNNDNSGTIFSQKTNITSKIDDFGFYTIGISVFISSGTAMLFGIGLVKGTVNGYEGDGVSGVCFFSAQLETGKFKTSYIPTLGSAVTRSKESFFELDIKGLLNGAQGVVFFEVAALGDINQYRQIKLTNDLNEKGIDFYFRGEPTSTNEIYVDVRNFGGVVRQVTDYTLHNKIAVKYAPNDMAVFLNGINIFTKTSGATFENDFFTKMSFPDFYGKIRSIMTYKDVITDAELINLTTI